MKKLAITLFSLSTVFGTSALAAETAQTTTNTQVPQQAAASYECGQDESVVVNYAFNESGVPTYAIFEQAEGDIKQLQINPSKSNESTLAFTSEDGYTLNASSSNDSTLFAQNVTITNPNNEVIYNDCHAISGD